MGLSRLFFIVSVSQFYLASALNPKIVGGEAARIVDVPYQASVQEKGKHVCGGTIIDGNFILTAAHCIYGFTQFRLKKDFTVVVGNRSYESGERYPVASGYMHQKYSNILIQNDIALLKLQEELQFATSVQPIALPEPDENIAVGTFATVSGWGVRNANGKISKKLFKAEVPITDLKQCKLSYQGLADITNNMICAGYENGLKDACQGDSGGPLVANGKLVGIVSFGYKCGSPQFPGVYTRVSAFVRWINNYKKRLSA